MKRIKSASSYFVADRKANTPAVTGSLLASIIGGSSTIGIAGLGYSKGLVGAWWMLVGAMGLVVLSLWFAGKVRSFEVYTLPRNPPETVRRKCGTDDRFRSDRRRMAGNYRRTDHRGRQDTVGIMAVVIDVVDDHGRIRFHHLHPPRRSVFDSAHRSDTGDAYCHGGGYLRSCRHRDRRWVFGDGGAASFFLLLFPNKPRFWMGGPVDIPVVRWHRISGRP